MDRKLIRAGLGKKCIFIFKILDKIVKSENINKNLGYIFLNQKYPNFLYITPFSLFYKKQN